MAGSDLSVLANGLGLPGPLAFAVLAMDDPTVLYNLWAMGFLAKLQKRLGLKAPHLRDRQRLEEAIRAGRLAPCCGLGRYFAEVEKTLVRRGWRGEDITDLSMEIEEYGRPVRTLADLLQMFEELDSEYEIDVH